MTYFPPPLHTNAFRGALSEEEDALRHLERLAEQRTLHAFKKGFERYGKLVKNPSHQTHLLLSFTRELTLKKPSTWKRVAERLQCCLEAGWDKTASFRTDSTQREKDRYDALWHKLEEWAPHSWEKYVRTHLDHTPADLKTLGTAMSLFLTLLPPPLGVTHHIENAFHLLNFPLIQALRLGMTDQVRPRFSEQAFHDHLFAGFMLGREWRYTPAFTERLGHVLFQEAHAWATGLSPSFFEHLLQQFLTATPVQNAAGRSVLLSLKERENAEGVLSSAQRLHTALCVTHALLPSETQFSSRKRL